MNPGKIQFEDRQRLAQLIVDLTGDARPFIFADLVKPGREFAQLLAWRAKGLFSPLMSWNVANGYSGRLRICGGDRSNRAETETVPAFFHAIDARHFTGRGLIGFKGAANASFQLCPILFLDIVCKFCAHQSRNRTLPRIAVEEGDSALAIDRHDDVGSIFDQRVPIIESFFQLFFDHLDFSQIDYGHLINELAVPVRWLDRNLDGHQMIVTQKIEANDLLLVRPPAEMTQKI